MEEAEEYAFNAIRGPRHADSVLLGKYEEGRPTSYDAVARSLGAQYFNLTNWDKLSNRYSKEELWKINRRFLDIQMSSGREIYLSHKPKDYLDKDYFYSWELRYLQENGYYFKQEGEVWHALR